MLGRAERRVSAAVVVALLLWGCASAGTQQVVEGAVPRDAVGEPVLVSR